MRWEKKIGPAYHLTVSCRNLISFPKIWLPVFWLSYRRLAQISLCYLLLSKIKKFSICFQNRKRQMFWISEAKKIKNSKRDILICFHINEWIAFFHRNIVIYLNNIVILYKYSVFAIFFAFIMFAYCIAISFRYYRSVNRDKVTDS